MRHLVCRRLQRSTGAALLVVLALNAVAPALCAQDSSVQPTTLAPSPIRPAFTEGPATRAAVSEEARRAANARAFAPSASASASSPGGGPGVGADIALGVVGAVAGFFAGLFTGYSLDRYAFGGDHCGCDDPGLKGGIVGAFIGVIALPIALIHWLG